LTRNY